jgi:hypothetical protein
MTITSNDVANQAIALAGNNIPPVAGYAPTFDSSAAGTALAKLYTPCYQTVAKQFGWDFARSVFTLSASGNTPPLGWPFEYSYPSAAIEILEMYPPTADALNPLPQNWTIGNALVGGVQTKVIWTNVANAQAVVNNAPNESTWDVGFREAMVRLLASELSMAMFGKPDLSQGYLESGSAFDQIAQSRNG